MKNTITVLLIIPFVLAIKEERITVKTERAELVSAHPLLGEGQIHTFKYNRTTTALNFTIIFKIPITPGDKVSVQAYKLASNEYRLFPVVFDAEICSSFKRNYFGMRNVQSCGNFTIDCPIRAGTYEICNWTPDYKHFPPHLVTGHFKIEMRYILKSQQAFVINWYILVADEMIVYENPRNN